MSSMGLLNLWFSLKGVDCTFYGCLKDWTNLSVFFARLGQTGVRMEGELDTFKLLALARTSRVLIIDDFCDN